MDVILKGVYCPECWFDSEAIEISCFNVGSIENVRIICVTCKREFIFSLSQIKEAI